MTFKKTNSELGCKRKMLEASHLDRGKCLHQTDRFHTP